MVRGNTQNHKGAGFNRWTERAQDKLPEPVPLDDLCPEAKRALDDIVFFARRYFGAILLPWQLEATKRIMEWFHSDNEEFVCVNAPPGSGKSYFFTRILPAWLTVKNRGIRGLIGSASHSTAEKYVLELRRELERTIPLQAETKYKKLGISVDAEATIPNDFGFFKPTQSDIWRANAFVVAQPGNIEAREKEPTWTAVGPDTSFIGGRYEFVIWDDLWDPQKTRSADVIENLKNWFSQVAESRLEPGGLFILQGQRLGADDIYRYALDQTGIGDTSEFDEDEVESLNLSEKKYRHLIFKAHYEELCTEKHSRKQAPWPDGCLLAPRRLSWQRLRPIRDNDSATFETSYQQEDVDPETVLVPKLWIYGGQDDKGQWFPGCIDKDREQCELPRGLQGELLSIATVDPSPEKFWAIQWWVIRVDNGEAQQRYLMDQIRQKMPATGFLDWNQATGKFVGFAEEWQQRSKELGWPISHWIVEKNAAQRFILQFEHAKRWEAHTGVQLIGHETHKNKSDPDFGVWAIREAYRTGMVRLFGGQNTQVYTRQLIHELTRWPAKGYDDCVMANWFMEWWLPQLVSRYNSRPAKSWRPSWLRNERAYRRGSSVGVG